MGGVRVVKIVNLLIIFSFFAFNSYADLKWKCAYPDMKPVPRPWFQSDAYYDPVEDCIYKVADDYWCDEFYLYRLKNGIWEYKIYPQSDSSFWSQGASSLYDERRGYGIPFNMIISASGYGGPVVIRHFNLEILLFEIDEGDPNRWPSPRYVAVNRESGKFLETYSDYEYNFHQYVGTHLLILDGRKIFNGDSLWQSDWCAAPMVWDERRNVVVKYGEGDWGWDISMYYDPSFTKDYGDSRLREWDGTTWTLRLDVPEPHPPKRMQRMVYDEARGVVVLVHILGETWEYDGKRWTNLTDQVGSIPSAYRPQIVYDTAHGHITLLRALHPGKFVLQLWALEDDATTQTYSRRNVMQEGCEMRTWGETGVDCSFTSSSTWSRIIMVKTEDGSAPDFARDYATSGIWAAPVLWEIKTDRPPDVCAAETTGTLVSISYPTGMVDCISSSTEALRLCVARPVEPIGVPISATQKNSERAFGQWQMLPNIDHPPAPGESSVYHGISAQRFLFRTTMQPPFYGSPAGAPRGDGKPASLCYTIITTAPDYRTIIKNALLGRRATSSAERRLLDQNADSRLDIADLITLINK